jgi:superfamily II DNA or RNA helicase/HKD family nuclease
MKTDLKFFTNEEGASLLDRFKSTLRFAKDFDVLVGYFRSSGFLHLYKSLEDVEKIRILVGLNVDKYTALANTNPDELLNKRITKEKAKKAALDIEAHEIEQESDDRNTEEGLRKFIEYLQSGKLEMRIYKEHLRHGHRGIHAKVYILKNDPEKASDFGRVITGSSNFSENGFFDQLEFNVELKDNQDVHFAQTRFDELWDKGVPVTNEYDEMLRTKTWLNNSITPYELYIKFLYEYFKDQMNDDKIELDVPKGFLDLSYQRDAVGDCVKKLNMYNGAILADVVGLGKTYIAALLARNIKLRALVIAPPTLIAEWKRVLNQFGVINEIISSGKLLNLDESDYDYFDLLIVDEAHRFRNEQSRSYDKLHSLAMDKKVLLLSATPYNNRPMDLAALLFLFQNRHDSNIGVVRDLDAYFKQCEKEINDAKVYARKHPVQESPLQNTVKRVSERIRKDILEHVLVRRTRSEVEKYYSKDLKQNAVRFPKQHPPEVIFYELDDNLNTLFDKTLLMIKGLNYARYRIEHYLIISDKEHIGEVNLTGFMKTLLIKRLDSSFYAFVQTLKRFARSYEYVLQMLEDGIVYVGDNRVFDWIDDEREDKIFEFLENEKLKSYPAEHFKPIFKEELAEDLHHIRKICKEWEGILYDPKIDALKQLLTDKIKKQKVLIFTESKETGDYLYKHLNSKDVMFVSSHSDANDIMQVKENFDPTIKSAKQTDDIRVIITTEVLAEGMNLHRANQIINYDIPWNPTRIMQRVGRINRVGSEHNEVFIYNFLPVPKSEKVINLEQAAKAKLTAFYTILGEDSKYLSDGEELGSHELFDKLQKLEEDTDEGISKYLILLRAIRDKEKRLFGKIKKLPRKSRSAKKSEEENLLTFYKKGALKKVIISNGTETADIDFFRAVELFECSKDEPRVEINSKFYDFREAIDEYFKNLVKTKTGDEQLAGAGHMANLVRTINQHLLPFVDEDLQNYLISLRGATLIGRLAPYRIKQASKIVKTAKSDPTLVTEKLQAIIPQDRLDRALDHLNEIQKSKSEIILSLMLTKADS